MASETDLNMNALRERLESLRGATSFEERCDGVWMEAPDLDVEAMMREMNAEGFRLATMTGRQAPEGETTIMYHFNRGPHLLHFKTRSHGGSHPSLALVSHPASWCERELHDFFAVKFDGHPNLVPLFRPACLNEGFFRDDITPENGPENGPEASQA
ncbi:NADH-quinone oxidoreductase subunit C [Breoghania sp. JC706]|uniref:NADH-quinone oxidoreductase subunit C n=1 Tax=Breoghania sp. JC706 TaxID=3117732 RepID=UPI0030091BB9